MEKIRSILVAVVMVVALTGCGSRIELSDIVDTTEEPEETIILEDGDYSIGLGSSQGDRITIVEPYSYSGNYSYGYSEHIECMPTSVCPGYVNDDLSNEVGVMFNTDGRGLRVFISGDSGIDFRKVKSVDFDVMLYKTELDESGSYTDCYGNVIAPYYVSVFKDSTHVHLNGIRLEEDYSLEDGSIMCLLYWK